jgi:hypothetical protein
MNFTVHNRIRARDTYFNYSVKKIFFFSIRYFRILLATTNFQKKRLLTSKSIYDVLKA